MSHAYPLPVKPVIVNTAEMDLTSPEYQKWVIPNGPEQTTFYKVQASSKSASQISFQSQPPSKRSCLDKHVYLECDVTVTIVGSTGASGPALMYTPGYFAPRAWPLQSCMTSSTMTVNGFPVSADIHRAIHVFNEMYKYNKEERDGIISVAPTMEDVTQNYSNVIGAVNNPLSPYYDNSFQTTRGSYWIRGITGNSATGVTLSYVFIEPIFLPPLSTFTKRNKKALTLLDTLTWNFTFQNRLAHMFSNINGAYGTTINSLNVSIDNAYLHLRWLTPKLTQSISPILNYSFAQLANYVTTINSNIAPFASQTNQPSQVIQLNSIPQKIYVYAKRAEQDYLASDDLATSATDTYLRLDKVSVSFDNRNSLLSSATNSDLYYMSCQGGLSMSHVEFYGLSQGALPGTPAPGFGTYGLKGSIVVIDPTKDLGLNSVEVEGAGGQHQLQITVDYTNINESLTFANVDIVIICVFDGILSIANNSAVASINVVSKNDILNAPHDYSYNYDDLQHQYGGSFWSKIADAAENVVEKYGPKIIDKLKKEKYISKGLRGIPHPAAQAASEVAELLGFGEGDGGYARAGGDPYGEYINANRNGEGMLTAGSDGGRLMSRRALKKRM